jgi:hypothetical protein
MRHQAALFLALALAACVPDQARDMADCQAEVMRFYPGYRAVKMDDPGTRFIVACMRARDYELDVTARDCSSRDPVATQPACYAPRHWFAAFIDRLRRYLAWPS